MNLRDLEYVAAVEQYRNFSKAAKACHVSQPALSTQVKKLEGQLGVELFGRTSHGVIVTEAGKKIVTTARDILRSAQNMLDFAVEFNAAVERHISIGIVPSLAPFILPYLRQSVAALSQDIKITYRESPLENLLAELDAREIDLVLTSGPVQAEGWNYYRCLIEPQVLMVSNKHPLAAKTRIHASDIPVEELLLVGDGLCSGLSKIGGKNQAQISSHLPDRPLVSNYLTASYCIVDGLGCVMLPKLACSAVRAVNPEIQYLEIDGRDFERDIGFISRNGGAHMCFLNSLFDQIVKHPPAGAKPALSSS